MAVELASLCKALGVLPRAGGLLDQDYYHVILLRAGLQGINKLEAYEAKKQQR